MSEPVVFGMSRRQWEELGNPPGSFDDVVEMARRNAEQLRRRSRRPHPWDEWDVAPSNLGGSDG